jgi:hypothetical protein
MTEIVYQPVPMTAEEIAERETMAIEAAQQEYEQAVESRRQAYSRIADPIFMQYQRGEATEKEWLAAVQSVKDSHPYPAQPK